MARVSVTVTGDERLIRTLDAMNPKKRRVIVRRSLTEIGTKVRDTIKTRYLRGPKPQHLERRTGRTIRGIRLKKRGINRGFVDVGVIEELWWLENYELGRGRRGKRPWLAPAVARTRPGMPDVFRRVWLRELDRA